MKNRIAFLLLTSMLASLAACGGADAPVADTTASGDTTAAVTDAPEEYVNPGVDYGGKTVTLAVRDIESVWKLAEYNITLSEVKTKAMVSFLNSVECTKSALIVTPAVEKNVVLSARNIPGVQTTFASVINVYDILKADKFVVDQKAVEMIQEVYAQ